MKKDIDNRLKDESLRKRIYQMETILDTALKKLEVLEKSIEVFKEYQEKIQELEDHSHHFGFLGMQQTCYIQRSVHLLE